MPRHKPIVPPLQPLGPSKQHYKLSGQSYKTTTLKIKWTPLKILGTTILLGVPYLGLILMVYSSGLKIMAAIIIGATVLIGGSIALLYYLNRE